jgi:hypothetical protein
MVNYPSEDKMSQRINRINVGILIILCAIIIRISLHYSVGQTLFADYPLVDAHTYWTQAQAIWDGENPFQEGLYQPPAYPYFLSAIGHLWGGPELGASRWIQVVLGVLTTSGLWWIGNRIGDELDCYWCGCITATLYSFYPTTLLFEQDWLTPTLSNFLTVSAIICLMSRKVWMIVLGGFLLGGAISVHPSLMLLGMAVIFWVWRQNKPPLLVIVGMCIALAPTVIWNIQDGKPALVSHNAGINLYIGNNTEWKETVFMRPGLKFRQWVLQADPSERDLEERNHYWLERTQNDILDSPMAWGGALLTKAYWSIHNTEIPRNEDYRCRTSEPALQWLRVIPIYYGWVLLFGVLGFFQCSLAPKQSKARDLSVLWLGAHLPLIVFFVSDRYRLSAWPFLALIAAIGINSLFKKVDSRALIVPIVAGFLSIAPIDSRTQLSDAWCLHVQGNLKFLAGLKGQAKMKYEESLEYEPENLSAHLYLGSIAEESSDWAVSKYHYQMVLDGYPEHRPSLMRKVVVCERLQDLECAIDASRRIYEISDGKLRYGLKLFKLLVRDGRDDEAQTLIEKDEALSIHPKVMEWRGGN